MKSFISILALLGLTVGMAGFAGEPATGQETEAKKADTSKAQAIRDEEIVLSKADIQSFAEKTARPEIGRSSKAPTVLR